LGIIKLVVGLGNPGKSYATTRHNLGYGVVDALEKDRFSQIDLFKPTGFMNSSGDPVSQEARRRGLNPQNILVICDDFSLPLGTLRLRLKGSSGGHNGLDSILQTFGTLEIPRLRLGIGPVPPAEDPADFVLESFKKSEKSQVKEMIGRAAKAVQVIADQGMEIAMNQFNQKAA
jgi:PTH1 family peptidyl-tRNA hydrolase